MMKTKVAMSNWCLFVLISGSSFRAGCAVTKAATFQRGYDED
jgi:hypothetical protein